jgi:putative hemolysin
MPVADIVFIILFIVCLGFAAFFCSAETAFIGMQKLRLHHLVSTGHPEAKIVARILEKPEKFLATVLLGINFFETAVATLGTVITISVWGTNLGAAIATIVVTILTLVLAELIPKSLATHFGEKLALSYARPIEITSIVLYPFVFLLNHIGIRFTRLFEENSTPRPTISREEFRTMISVGHKEGTVEKGAAEMLRNVFDFGDSTAREVMVPRPQVVFIEWGSKVADFLNIYTQNPLSRFPVFQHDRDNVVGILSVKDVLMALAKETIDSQSVINNMVRPAYFTPETKHISELFADMRDNNYHMAVVIDEFGGVAGVVSLSQLIEEIVGPVKDELVTEGKDYKTVNEHTFQIDGSMRIEEANEQLGLGLPDGEYETVAGFVLHLLGRIPKQGDQLKYSGLKMIITKMRGMKVEEVLLTRENITKAPDRDAASTD